MTHFYYSPVGLPCKSDGLRSKTTKIGGCIKKYEEFYSINPLKVCIGRFTNNRKVWRVCKKWLGCLSVRNQSNLWIINLIQLIIDLAIFHSKSTHLYIKSNFISGRFGWSTLGLELSFCFILFYF